MTENPGNVEADKAAEIEDLTMSLNNFASVQGAEISQVNDQVSELSNSINLLRSYTPEPDSAPSLAGDQGAEPGDTAEGRAALDADLATVLNEINPARPDPSSNEADPANWTAEPPAQPDTMSQDAEDLQKVSTQLDTEVQTETAQASQTTQMSNAMSQAASTVLANLTEEAAAASKE